MHVGLENCSVTWSQIEGKCTLGKNSPRLPRDWIASRLCFYCFNIFQVLELSTTIALPTTRLRRWPESRNISTGSFSILSFSVLNIRSKMFWPARKSLAFVASPSRKMERWEVSAQTSNRGRCSISNINIDICGWVAIIGRWQFEKKVGANPLKPFKNWAVQIKIPKI